MKFGLSESMIEKFCLVFEKYSDIEKVLIFGSRAKGNFREGSDIDISLFGDRVTEEIRSKVWLDIDELNSPYLIDISVFHLLTSESLKQHIQRVGKVFYTKKY